ncbi:hypothetical protein D3C75_1321720 [compost metagenome]
MSVAEYSFEGTKQDSAVRKEIFIRLLSSYNTSYITVNVKGSRMSVLKDPSNA